MNSPRNPLPANAAAPAMPAPAAPPAPALPPQAGDANPARHASDHALLDQLWQWADAGLLRRLDAALAQWVAEHDPSASATLLLASALLSCLEGKGHTCLPLDAPAITSLLGWPIDAPVDTPVNTPIDAPADGPFAIAAAQRHLPRTPQDWLAQLKSTLVWQPDQGSPDQGQPLVITHGLASSAASGGSSNGAPESAPALRLHLRRYWVFEQQIARMLHTRNQASAPPDEASTAAIAQWLDVLFPSGTAAAPGADFNWQKAACAIALRSRTSIITGGPGTGKTYTAARLLAAALALHPEPSQMRIGLAAPTGKAAARLKESIQKAVQELPAAIQQNPPLHHALQNLPAARTLHSLLGMRPDTRALRYHAGNPLVLDLLLVDEASMIHLEMMHNLLAALSPGARLVLLGDKDQLASVEAGSVLGDFCAHAAAGNYLPETAHYLQQATGQALPADMLATTQTASALPALAQHTVMLRQSRRFDGPIGALAQAVNQGDTAAMHAILQNARKPMSMQAPKQGALKGSSIQPSKAAFKTQLEQLEIPLEMPLEAPAETPASPLYWLEGANAQTLEHIALHGRPGPQGGATASYGDLARALQNAPGARADAAAHAQWVRDVLHTLERFRILCATREGEWGVAGANARVLHGLRQAGVPVKSQGWFAGRVVQVTQNNPDLRIFNGDVGICLPGPGHSAGNAGPLRVYFPTAATEELPATETSAPHSISVTRLNHVETAFAMTVHKSQGSEFEHVMLLLPAHAGALPSRELVYTGLTRARQAFTYLAPQPGAWLQATQTRTLRTSGLGDALAAAAHAAEAAP